MSLVFDLLRKKVQTLFNIWALGKRLNDTAFEPSFCPQETNMRGGANTTKDKHANQVQ